VKGSWWTAAVVALVVALLLGQVLPVLGQQPAVPSDYRLRPGDVIEILVMGEADLTRTVTVRPDGKISYPLLGDVPVAGMTAAEVADSLSALLRKYLRNPVVTVTVTQIRQDRTFVYLLGPGVVRPGSYEIQPGWTVMEAIASAGGLAPRANLRRAVLIRRGKADPIPLDLERLVLRGDQSANMAVEPGDIILVPSQQNRVLVLGAVRSPGAYDVDEGARLVDAISLAGGPADRAGIRQVGIIRQGVDGKMAVTTVNFERVLRQGDATQNPLLQHGDIVYIPPDTRVNWLDVLSWLSGLRLIQAVFGIPGP